MFETNPEKSKIVLKEKCSECGSYTIIEITPTSGGFGLQGGVLFKCSPDKYIAKCPACYKTLGDYKRSGTKLTRYFAN